MSGVNRKKVKLNFRPDGTYDSEQTITDDEFNSSSFEQCEKIRLERNRLAAIESRRKRKMAQEECSKALSELEKKNQALQKEVEQLNKRIKFLEKKLVDEHNLSLESYMSGETLF